MPKLQLQVAKIVGQSTSTGWSQIHHFSPEDSQKKERRGELLAVIGLSGLQPGIEAVAAGREVLSRLHEEYYGFLEDSPFIRLQRAVAKVCAEPAGEASVEISAAALVDDVLYLAVQGKGRVILCRQNQLAVLLEGQKKSVASASGYLQDNDLFLLGSSGFFQLAAEGVLQASLVNDDLDQVAEALALVVQNQATAGLSAVAVAKAKVLRPAVVPRLGEETKPVSPKVSLPTAAPLKEKTLSFFASWQNRLGQLFFVIQKKLGKKTIYLRQKTENQAKKETSPKTAATVALILLFLLAVSMVLGSRQRQKNNQEEKIAGLQAQVQAKKQEGEEILTLNPLGAKKLLLEAWDLFAQIEALGPLSQENQVLQDELTKILAQVVREHAIQPKSFFDLTMIKKEAKVTDLAFSAEKLIILDAEEQSVYGVGLADKSQAILTGGTKITGESQVAAFLPQVYVLTDEGIAQTNTETGKQTLVVTKDEAWGEIIDLAAFGGNLYLLDKSGEIWQYPAIEAGFGARRRWLKTQADFGQAVSMAIDGAIWVLAKDGAITKYVRGEKDFFNPAGLDQPLASPTVLFVAADQDYLYLLDKGNLRVVVLTKSGEYHSQYSWDGIRDVVGLAAWEKEGQVFLSAGQQIYSFNLENQ